MELILERQVIEDGTSVIKTAGGTIAMTPALDEDYWSYRVKVSETQAVVGFPKFFTTGIGFAVEEDWNTNLPASTPAVEIFDHISHNKGDDSIRDEDVLKAIEMIQEAVREDKNGE